jgi:PAS domain-containing protein
MTSFLFHVEQIYQKAPVQMKITLRLALRALYTNTQSLKAQVVEKNLEVKYVASLAHVINYFLSPTTATQDPIYVATYLFQIPYTIIQSFTSLHSAYHIRKRRAYPSLCAASSAVLLAACRGLGLSDGYREPDRHKIELTNRLTFIITGITIIVYFAGLALQVNDMTTCNFIMMSICLLYWPLMKAGYLMASRVALLFVLYNMQFYIAVVSGSKSGMADLLLTTSMIPMMLFGRKNIKWGIFFIVQCVSFYFLYDMFVVYWDQYAMPLDTQLKTHAIMTPVKVVTLLITMFLLLRTMIDSEAEYEGRKKVLEKQRNYYFNILDSMPIQVGIYGPDMRHSYLNRKAVARTLGMLSKMSSEQAVLDINDAPVDSHRAERLRRCAETQDIVEEEVEYLDRKGRRHTELQGRSLCMMRARASCWSISATRSISLSARMRRKNSRRRFGRSVDTMTN